MSGDYRSAEWGAEVRVSRLRCCSNGLLDEDRQSGTICLHRIWSLKKASQPLCTEGQQTSPATCSSYLMFLEALMISLMRGTPSVMFMEATPAKWKVFRVIWVPGSPMLWAQRAPTAEPGSIWALCGRYKTMSWNPTFTTWNHFFLLSALVCFKMNLLVCLERSLLFRGKAN